MEFNLFSQNLISFVKLHALINYWISLIILNFSIKYIEAERMLKIMQLVTKDQQKETEKF
jgi:hypothetical protein